MCSNIICFSETGSIDIFNKSSTINTIRFNFGGVLFKSIVLITAEKLPNGLVY